MTKVYNLFDSEFFLFINGDILLSPFICSELRKLNIQSRVMRIYGTCDRHNVFVDKEKKIENINFHYVAYKTGQQYTLCGQDAYLTNKNTFNKKQIGILNEIGVGRIKIDNIILGMAIKDKNITTIDFSDIFQAIHLQYRNNYRIIKRDYYWNNKILIKLSSPLIGLACMDRIKWKISLSNNTLVHRVE